MKKSLGIVFSWIYVWSLVAAPIASGSVGVDHALHLQGEAADRDGDNEMVGNLDIISPLLGRADRFLYLSPNGTAESADYYNGGLLLGMRGLFAEQSVLLDAYAGGDFTRTEGNNYRQLTAGIGVNVRDWFSVSGNYYLPDEEVDLLDRVDEKSSQQFVSESSQTFCNLSNPRATHHRIVQDLYRTTVKTKQTTTVSRRDVFDRDQLTLEGWDVRGRLNLKALPVTMPSVIGGYTDLDGAQAVQQNTTGYFAGLEWQLTEGLSVYGKYDEVTGRTGAGEDGETSVGVQLSVPLKRDGLKQALSWYRPAGKNDLGRRLNAPTNRRHGVSVGTTDYQRNEELSYVKQKTDVDKSSHTIREEIVLKRRIIFVADPVDGVPTAEQDGSFDKGKAENPYTEDEIAMAVSDLETWSAAEPTEVITLALFPLSGGAAYQIAPTVNFIGDGMVDIVSGDCLRFTPKKLIGCELVDGAPNQTLTDIQTRIDGGWELNGTGFNIEANVCGFEIFNGKDTQFDTAGVLALNINRLGVFENDFHDIVADGDFGGAGVRVINDGDFAGLNSAVVANNTFITTDVGVDVLLSDVNGAINQSIDINNNYFEDITLAGVRGIADEQIMGAKTVNLNGSITNNLFVDMGTRGIYFRAVGAQAFIGTEQVPFLVQNNTMNEAGSDGIRFDVEESGSTFFTVDSNFINGIEGAGFGMVAFSDSGGSITGTYSNNNVADDNDSEAGYSLNAIDGSVQNITFAGGNSTTGHGDHALAVNAEDATLNLTLDGTGVSNLFAATNSAIDAAINVETDGNAVLDFDAFGNNTVVNNAGGGYAFDLQGATQANIHFDGGNFVAFNFGGPGMFINANGATLDLTIENGASFSANAGSGVAVNVAGLTNFSSSISGSTFQSNVNAGLVINSFTLGSFNASASGNDFLGNGGNGMSVNLLVSQGALSVLGNNFNDNGANGLSISSTLGQYNNLLIQNNAAGGNQLSGIRVDIDLGVIVGGAISSNIVSGNNLSNAATHGGIVIDNQIGLVNFNAFNNNTVSGNLRDQVLFNTVGATTTVFAFNSNFLDGLSLANVDCLRLRTIGGLTAVTGNPMAFNTLVGDGVGGLGLLIDETGNNIGAIAVNAPDIPLVNPAQSVNMDLNGN